MQRFEMFKQRKSAGGPLKTVDLNKPTRSSPRLKPKDITMKKLGYSSTTFQVTSKNQTFKPSGKKPTTEPIKLTKKSSPRHISKNGLSTTEVVKKMEVKSVKQLSSLKRSKSTNSPSMSLKLTEWKRKKQEAMEKARMRNTPAFIPASKTPSKFPPKSATITSDRRSTFCAPISTGQIQQGRKSLPATTAGVQRSNSTKQTITGVSSTSSTLCTRQSLPFGSNSTKDSKPATKPVSRSLSFSAAQNKSSFGQSKTVGKTTNGARKSMAGVGSLAQIVSAGRKSLPLVTGKSNTKPASPWRRKSVNMRMNTGKTLPGKSTLPTGATNRLSLSKAKSGAAFKHSKPRRSILKSQIDAKNVQNATVGATLVEETEEDVDKENVKNNKIEILKQTSKSVHFISPCRTPRTNTARATPVKTPVKEASMREKLDAWLKAKNKTPSRFRHLMCFGDHLECESNKLTKKKVKGGLTPQQLDHQQECLDQEGELRAAVIESGPISTEDKDSDKNGAQEKQLSAGYEVSEMLAECFILYESGCPRENIVAWLNEISALSEARRCAKYWILLARLSEAQSTVPEIVEIYEEAIKYEAEPPQEIKSSLEDYLKTALTKASPWKQSVTKKPRVEKCLSPSNVFDSCVVKYLISDTTPCTADRSKKRVRGLSTPGSRVTPVRRSTRRSVASLPRGLQDHDPVVARLDQIPTEQKQDMLYTPNTALQQKLMERSCSSEEEEEEETDTEEEANPTKCLQSEFDMAAAEEQE